MFIQGKALGVALCVACPTLTFAQDFSGAATLGFGRSSLSDGGPDVNAPSLDATGLINFNNGFYVGLDGHFKNIDPSGGSASLSLFDVGTSATYQFSSGFTVGGYLDYMDSDLSGLGGGFGSISGSATSYGLTGGFVRNDLGVEFHLGMTDTSPSLPSGVDWVDYGVNLRYVAATGTKLGANVQRSNVSGNGADVNFTNWGVGADHEFGAGWSAFGGLTRATITGGNDMTTVGLGVGYDLAQKTSLPAEVSLELARSDVSSGNVSGDINTLRFGFTMPLGKRDTATPLNSVARSAMSPRHNAVSSIVETMF